MGSATRAEPDVIDVDMAAILYTSGSTGKPKGVVLSHRNVLTGGASVSQYLENDESDVILAALPLSFDAGFSQLTTAFTVGAHVVLVNYLLARDIVRLCAKHQVTGLTCVPPLYIQLTEQDWPDEATRQWVLDRQPFGRWGEPDDAARTIAFLCSEDAAWVTGQVIVSSGGGP